MNADRESHLNSNYNSHFEVTGALDKIKWNDPFTVDAAELIFDHDRRFKEKKELLAKKAIAKEKKRA